MHPCSFSKYWITVYWLHAGTNYKAKVIISLEVSKVSFTNAGSWPNHQGNVWCCNVDELVMLPYDNNMSITFHQRPLLLPWDTLEVEKTEASCYPHTYAWMKSCIDFTWGIGLGQWTLARIASKEFLDPFCILLTYIPRALWINFVTTMVAINTFAKNKRRYFLIEVFNFRSYQRE